MTRLDTRDPHYRLGRRSLFVAAIAAAGTRPALRSPAMSTDLIYEEYRTAILDGSGNATITFQAPGSLTSRKLSTVVIDTTPATPRPSATVYRGNVAPHRKMASSRLGDSDTFIADGEVLRTGEPLIVVVAGGAAGAKVNCNAFGTDTRA